MGEDPEQLEREIEATRAKLGDDIDALEEKINPKKVAHRSVETAKVKAADLKDKVVGKAAETKDKVAAKASDTRDKVTGGPGEETVVTTAGYGGAGSSAGGGGLGEKVSGLAGTVKQKAAPLAGTVMDKAAPLAGTVKEKAAVRSGLDPQTADSRQVATAFAGETWATLQDQTRRNPVAVGAAAFVVGVLLGR